MRTVSNALATVYVVPLYGKYKVSWERTTQEDSSLHYFQQTVFKGFTTRSTYTLPSKE